ncbi:kunitz-type serine protease inhibitor A-like [Spodoptera frugiperda]|uniref:Kunitz-type serine protease inhibitor A-like n=1 Tax=Spodoptera frugiperda TaxID=7108 RepID=A0A9R0CZX5_SPOFR|nr:kunitz-type serine protease inhibitor A-like [Spodoptera frugiperda]
MNSEYLQSYIYVFFPSFLWILMHISLSSSQIISSNTKNNENSDSKEIGDITQLPKSMYCRIQPNRNQCGRHSRTSLRYYWDVHGKSCQRFDYGNCDNSYNMFSSIPSCKDECEEDSHILTFTNVTANVFCFFQPEFGNCNSYHPRWYFDINEMKCKGFSFSGCGGNHNRFDTANHCMHTCSEFIHHLNGDR